MYVVVTDGGVDASYSFETRIGAPVLAAGCVEGRHLLVFMKECPFCPEMEDVLRPLACQVGTFYIFLIYNLAGVGYYKRDFKELHPRVNCFEINQIN